MFDQDLPKTTGYTTDPLEVGLLAPLFIWQIVAIPICLTEVRKRPQNTCTRKSSPFLYFLQLIKILMKILWQLVQLLSLFSLTNVYIIIINILNFSYYRHREHRMVRLLVYSTQN